MNEAHLEGQSRLRNVARFIPVGIWLVLITYLSLVSGSYLRNSWIGSIPNKDKLFHFGVYFVTSVLMMYGLQRQSSRFLKKGIVTVTFCLVWGGTLECLQGAMAKGRHFEVFDIIANIIGALVGVVVFSFIFKKRYYGS